MYLAFGLSNVWTMEPSEYQTITSLEAINDAKKKNRTYHGLNGGCFDCHKKRDKMDVVGKCCLAMGNKQPLLKDIVGTYVCLKNVMTLAL